MPILLEQNIDLEIQQNHQQTPQSIITIESHGDLIILSNVRVSPIEKFFVFDWVFHP
ncbi:MAG: hypothetical protein CNIPEHKO_02764 [Anaerolineales bacterium]|nr:hypothetical protein [Anaerolineales bacterium]